MVVIGGLQKTPEERLDADDLKVLPAHCESPDRPCGAVSLETEAIDAEGSNRRKHRISITDIAHFGIGEDRLVLMGGPERHTLGCMRHIDWSQDQCLNHTE